MDNGKTKAIVAGIAAVAIALAAGGCSSNTSQTRSGTGQQVQSSQQAQSQAVQSSKVFLFSNEDIGGISVAEDQVIATFDEKEGENGGAWEVSTDGTVMGQAESTYTEPSAGATAQVTTDEPIDDTSVKMPDGSYRTELVSQIPGRYEYTISPLSSGESAIEFSFGKDSDDAIAFTLFVTVDENIEIVDARIEGADFTTKTVSNVPQV